VADGQDAAVELEVERRYLEALHHAV